MLHFVTPAWLFGLLLMPLLGLIHWQTVQRERDDVEEFAHEGALRKMDVRPSADLRLWRGMLLLGAIAALLVALAQPRWGPGGGPEARARDGSLVVVLDVSKSMRVRDVNAETRLRAAQGLLEELLPRLAGWRVGVVAFAGEAEALCPLTSDHEAVRTLLARAKPGAVAGKGSNLEVGLRTAAGLFRQPGPRTALLLSDGEQLAGDAEAAVAAIREARVTLHAVGLGTPEGGPIPGEPDVWGNPTFLTYRGEQVTSKLDPRTLTRVAEATGGTYVAATDPRAGEAIAARLGVGLGAAPARPAGDGESQAYELFQLPLVLAIGLSLAEAVLALVGRPRRQLRFADALRVATRPAVAGAASMRGAAPALLVAIALTQGGWTWYPTWLPNGEAGQAYQAGDMERAEGLLRGALRHDPGNFRLRYNLGNVLHERGNFAEAARVYQEALGAADAAARPLIRYNLGNTHFRLAEQKGDPKLYERAIADYEAVLVERPDDRDAKHNLAVARARLKQANKQANKPQNGQSGQGRNGGQGQNGPTPVGVQTRYKPPPPMKHLPSQSEVDSLLRALEQDERQRQAEQASEPRPGSSNEGPNAENLLEQALGGLDMNKDW